MAWSIFREGGGSGAAVTWAEDLEQELGIPQSSQNTQFIYDWEVSEGGGGKYNPLNQGPVPGHPELTSTGQQYGGGAADYVSWQAGLEGATDYLHMPAYSGVLSSLQHSDYGSAAAALWASPWAASHYGYGGSWSYDQPPGKGTPLPVTAADIQTAQASGSSGQGQAGGGLVGSLVNGLFGGNFVETMQRVGLILLGSAMILLGIWMITSKQTLKIAGITVNVPKEKRDGKRAANTERPQNQGNDGS